MKLSLQSSGYLDSTLVTHVASLRRLVITRKENDQFTPFKLPEKGQSLKVPMVLRILKHVRANEFLDKSCGSSP